MARKKVTEEKNTIENKDSVVTEDKVEIVEPTQETETLETVDTVETAKTSDAPSQTEEVKEEKAEENKEEKKNNPIHQKPIYFGYYWNGQYFG